jgi:hypothetical protein
MQRSPPAFVETKNLDLTYLHTVDRQRTSNLSESIQITDMAGQENIKQCPRYCSWRCYCSSDSLFELTNSNKRKQLRAKESLSITFETPDLDLQHVTLNRLEKTARSVLV